MAGRTFKVCPSSDQDSSLTLNFASLRSRTEYSSMRALSRSLQTVLADSFAVPDRQVCYQDGGQVEAPND